MLFRRVTVFIFMLLGTLSLSAQKNDNAGIGKINGRIVDSATGQPVEYASVSITLLNDTKEINGATTDEKGAFEVTGIAEGSYKLLVFFVGYQNTSKSNIVISAAKPNVSTGDIKLHSTTASLKAVQVTASKAIIENKIDKMVYNVENDLTSQTGAATDVLKKIPQVDVDIDGNVELQGDANIRFLINGKPSTMFGNSITDVLQAIPASQIQSIEVITSPGAKYDAEGTGGIINIILKKATAQGINGNVSLSGGTRLENGSFNLNARKGTFGAHAYLSGNGQLSSTTLTSSKRTGQDTGSTTSTLLQNGSTNFTRQGYQAGGGFDWKFLPKNTISGSIGYFYYGYDGSGNSTREGILQDLYGNKLTDSTDILNNSNKYHSHSTNYNLDYKKEFAKEGQELDISYNSSFGNDFSSYTQSQQSVSDALSTSGSQGSNPDITKGTIIGIDYTNPINDSLTFEVGAKAELNTINSTANVYLLNTATDNYDYSSTESNSLSYQNSVYAAYASITFRLFHWLDVKAGYRDEYTMTQANFSSVGNVNIPSYNTPVPSATISHKFKNNQTLKLSYTHRIERPDDGDLNPYINATDPQNITTGNPYLKPEIGNKIELGYSKTFDKGSNIFVTLFYRGNINDMQQYTTFYPTYKIGDSTYTNVAVTERANIGHEDNYGLNIYGSIPITSKINIRGNLSGFQRYIVTGLSTGGNVQGFNYRTNMNITYELTKTFTMEGFVNFNSPRINAQGTYPSFTTYSLAIRKQLFHKNGSIALTAMNAFSKYVNQTTNLTGSNFTLVSTREVPYQSFGFNFTYKFGKLEFKQDKEPSDAPNMDSQGGGN